MKLKAFHVQLWGLNLHLWDCNDFYPRFSDSCPAKASQQPIEALRRRLSNLANGHAPEPEVPGAPLTAQSSGSYSAGNPSKEVVDMSPPYGRYHDRENSLVETPPMMTLEPTLPDPEPVTTLPEPEPVATPPEPEPVATPPKAAPMPAEPGLVTPEACAPAPSPATEVEDEPGCGDSVSACGEMPPPSNPYWKFLGNL